MHTLFPEMQKETQYKVLTLWQPWATLLAYGFKKIETRPSPTNYTFEYGSYLIHAAKKWTNELDAISKQSPFKEALKGLPLITGAIIGVIDITECTPIIEDYDRSISLLGLELTLTDQEIAFGDYREGRYAWICANARILETPIPYKNGQGYYQNFKGDINLLKFK